MSNESKLQHWHLNKDEEGILWLALDRADNDINRLNWAVLAELKQVIEQLPELNPKGLVISSAKKNGFISGADVQEFSQVKDVNQAVEIVRMGQKLMERLAQLKIPTVALIQGFCLGGGLELALACDYRVAEVSDSTRLGLPEVMLGIHPGWGGTVRLPRMIGPLAAMDLMLTGRSLKAKVAYRLGLVDAAEPKRQLENAVRYFIRQQPPKQCANWWQRLLNTPLVRPLIASVLRRRLKQKIQEDHYPAPFAIIENWLTNGAHGDRAYLDEANSIGKLLLSDTAKNLTRVYLLQQQLKDQGHEFKGKVEHVHVVGAGQMGGDIAAWCALKGLQVTLQDRNIHFIAPAIARAQSLFQRRLKTRLAIRDAMDRLIPDPEGHGIAHADVVIEAIFEDLVAKQALFEVVEAKAKPDALIATNTSSLLLDDINKVMQDPSRLVGIHFFNPVRRMQLVEVVQSKVTESDRIHQAIAFVGQIGRLPLPVKSSPGFLVNRVLVPYLEETWALLMEGIPLTAIDKAAKHFGMPMGPVELADTIGLDVCVAAAKNLSQYYPIKLPKILLDKVNAGKLGRKTGEGFYRYRNNKVIKPKLSRDYKIPKDAILRLVIRLANEAMACLREGVVADADLVDVGIIFGTGFAPFRGGPLHYANELDKEQRQEVFQRLQLELGDRFKADNGWV